MNSTIDELYYGNITPNELMARPDGRYAKLMKLIAKYEEQLSGTLSGEQKKAFESFRDCSDELTDIAQRNAFSIGFKLGLKLTAESLIELRPELERIGD